MATRNIGKIGTVTGLEDIVGQLRLLEKRIVKGGVDKALRAASRPVIQAIRAEVPVESGALKKSIGLKLRTYGGRTRRVSIIGARSKVTIYKGEKRNPAYYAHLVEFGVKPHLLRPKGLRKLLARGAVHPGHPGTGAFRRGFEAGEGTAAAELVRVLRETVAANTTPTSAPGPDEA